MYQLSSLKLRASCPDCWQELNVRFWRPEAGGWYLKLQERFAAGRGWSFRHEDGHWIVTI